MKKIQHKLLLVLIIVAVLPAAITELFTYQSTKNELKKETYHRLNATMNHRIDLMFQEFTQALNQAKIVAKTPYVIDELVLLNDPKNNNHIVSNVVQSFFEDIKSNRQLHNIYLITENGDISFSLKSSNDLNTNIYTSIFNQSHMANLVQKVLTTKQPAYSKFDSYQADNNTITAFIAHPVMSNDTLIGSVVFQITPSIFHAAIQSELTIGDTGEVLLAHLHNSKLHYVSPLRFSPKDNNNFSLNLYDDINHATTLAVKGANGHGALIDYRLENVLAQWRYIEKYNLGMVVKIDEAQAMSQINVFQLTLYLIFSAISIPVIIIAYLISRHYTRPIIDVVNSTNTIANGNIEDELIITSADEIGQLATSINEMSNHINQAFKNEEAERWLQEGVVKLSTTMRGNQISTDLADNIVSFVCSYLNAKVGSLYIVKDEELELAGSFAFVPQLVNQTIEFGDGLVGQAAMSKSVITINDLPKDYMHVSSSMGKILPQTLVVFPLIKDDVVVGVIELGWLDREHAQTYTFLDAISESMATALSVAESHHKLQILLDQSQQQMEELQVREEELRAINDEVEQRSTQLANSQKKLEQQSQELQSTNDALEYKNSAIEAKNAEIEISRQEISKKAEELEISSKYKSEFLANMSHELRTPLNSMLILSRILSDNYEGNLDDDQVESSKVIHSSGQELLSLINDILDLSKIEAGKMEVLYESYNLRDITHELNGQFKAITDEKGLTFDVIIDNNVPRLIPIDVQKVQQVLKNLLSNAIKFTEIGGVTISAKIASNDQVFNLKSLSEQPVLAISIIDSGIGISAEKQKAIFEAFQQADGSTSRKYGGSGLGLTISRHLTGLIQGELNVESVLNQGSTFTLYLPMKNTVENANEYEESLATATKNSIATNTDMISNTQQSLLTHQQHMNTIDDNNKIIVIIEDDINFSKVLSSLATKYGFNCVLANTGTQGINLVKEHNPCGVILDLGLPDMSGADILDMMKNHSETRDIPVHIISGHDKTKELTDRGAAAFHQKPVATQEIESLLYSLMKYPENNKQQQLVVFNHNDSNSSIDLSFLTETPIQIINVDSLDELSHFLSNSDHCVNGVIIKSQSLNDNMLIWLNDSYQFNSERDISVIIFVDNEPDSNQITSLQQFNCHVIINGAHSNERLHDEISLFLSTVENPLSSHTPIESQSMVTTAVIDPKIENNNLVIKNEIDFSGCEVLLVDDDLRNTFSLSKVLKKQGMKVILADNGQMALDRLAVNDGINIVLMDIMMPIMDGHEAMKKIRQQDKYINLPVIALTAKAMQEDRVKCIEAGASDYLTKPVDIDKLITMMHVWLYQEVT